MAVGCDEPMAKSLSPQNSADVAACCAAEQDGLLAIGSNRMPKSGRSLREADPAQCLALLWQNVGFAMLAIRSAPSRHTRPAMVREAKSWGCRPWKDSIRPLSNASLPLFAQRTREKRYFLVSHRKAVFPLILTAESGCLISCAMEAVSCPIAATRLACASSICASR